MAGTAPRHDVIVVGAGASGCSAARELATDHDVLLLDAGEVGGGASGQAAGFVSVFDEWAPYPDAVKYAIESFRSLDGTHGFEFVDRPYLELLRSEAEVEAARDTYEPLLVDEGYELAVLDAEAISARWPGRFDLTDIAGGVLKPESGIIDPKAFTVALAEDARDRGVDVRTQTRVEQIRTDDEGVMGVVADGESIAADTVVCTAGAQTDRLVEPFAGLPVRQFIYCNVRVMIDGDLPPDYPMVYGDDVWWRPEPWSPGTLLVSGGMYFLPERDRPPRRPPVEFLEEVERTLPRLATDVETVRFVTGSEHTCPNGTSVTPDGQAIIDAPAGAPDGLVIATAVDAGISMAPFTGRAVRSLVAGEASLVPFAPFALARFDEVEADFRIHGISEMPGEFPGGTDRQ